MLKFGAVNQGTGKPKSGPTQIKIQPVGKPSDVGKNPKPLGPPIKVSPKGGRK